MPQEIRVCNQKTPPPPTHKGLRDGLQNENTAKTFEAKKPDNTPQQLRWAGHTNLSLPAIIYFNLLIFGKSCQIARLLL